jgi:hypothetical protein
MTVCVWTRQLTLCSGLPLCTDSSTIRSRQRSIFCNRPEYVPFSPSSFALPFLARVLHSRTIASIR